MDKSSFPDGFLFGAATSAYQIEGHGYGGAGPTHWDTFAKISGKVANGETGKIACDHYHLYEQDLDLLRGFDAYRFSTSWARVLPEGRGQVNQAGLDYYDRLVDAILARGLKPFLTLYHWELPAALAQLGGWTNPDIAQWFGDYCDIVMRPLSDRVAFVATINEPWCITYLAHYLGHHAPGLQDMNAMVLSVHNLLRSHSEAVSRLRASGQDNLGIVLNFESLIPHRQNCADIAATKTYGAIMNRMFLQPLIKGGYPAEILPAFEPHLPKNWQDDMGNISAPLDWLGVNYYTRQTVAADKTAKWPHVKFMPTDADKTQMGWDIYPQGLQEILVWVAAEYTADLPLYVTENGMARADQPVEGNIDDTERSQFIFQHLQQVADAVNFGVPVKGFFYWSLLDNFEWAYGYEKRFGLVHVDFTSQKRTPKQSYIDFKTAFAKGA